MGDIFCLQSLITFSLIYDKCRDQISLLLQVLHRTIINLHVVYSLLKGTATAAAVELLKLNILKAGHTMQHCMLQKLHYFQCSIALTEWSNFRSQKVIL